MKPKTPATTKALQAWKSELSHLEQRLGEWANQLAERERIVEEQEAALEAALDKADDETVERYASTWEDAHGEDCGCSDSDAGGGCDCPKCQNTRANWIGGENFTKYFHVDPTDLDLHIGIPHKRHFQPRLPKPVGDEIKWLETLWKLEDPRKKKK